MQALGPVERWMAVLLAALAGYVDSIGFLQLGGLFVSFMSGNTTRMAAGLAQGDWRLAGVAGLILLLFVTGAMLGALVASGAGPHTRAIRVKDAHNTGLQTMVHVVSHRHCLLETLGFVVATTRTNRVHITPVIFVLRVHQRIAVYF